MSFPSITESNLENNANMSAALLSAARIRRERNLLDQRTGVGGPFALVLPGFVVGDRGMTITTWADDRSGGSEDVRIA